MMKPVTPLKPVAAPALQLELDIDRRDARWASLSAALADHARFVWQHLDLPAGEVCLVLADDALLAALNSQYRGKAGPTNVLSFAAQDFTAAEVARATLTATEAAYDAPLMLGDIVLSYDRLAAEAAAADKSLDAHALHLLTHGLLHLLGHDHQDETEAEVMEGLESRLLKAAGQADPYLAAHQDAVKKDDA